MAIGLLTKPPEVNKPIDGQNVLNYTEFNFVGTQLTTPLDISEMTHFSVDIMMLELPTDIDLLLTFRMKILILFSKTVLVKVIN
jgi:hypothetical protein